MSKTKRKLSFMDALAALQDKYSRSAGKGGTMTLDEINEILRLQIQANQESGEE